MAGDEPEKGRNVMRVIDRLFITIIAMYKVQKKLIFFPHNYTGEKIVKKKKHDLSLFSNTDIKG